MDKRVIFFSENDIACGYNLDKIERLFPIKPDELIGNNLSILSKL